MDVLATTHQVDVDGLVDRNGVKYIGKATLMEDGTWRALANVGGALCVVECMVKVASVDGAGVKNDPSA